MNIENLRRLRGWNQNDLAEVSGLTQPDISRAEKGSDGMTLRKFKAIAGALNVPLADLFQDDRARSENELLDMFRRLPSDRQALWMEMSRTFVRDPSAPSAGTPRTGRLS
jgi:transcriptional regulator with XRE-family HTH domain